MKSDIVHSPALELGLGHFSSAPDSVSLTGKVFEIGDYPDRGFAIDSSEMDQAIAQFTPVANDLEHSRLRDVLGNSLGELRKLWRVGSEVFGEVTVPKWLADLTGNVLKVSLAFDGSKRVVGNALTLSPRIGDAEVAAAFSSAVPSEGWFERFVGWLRSGPPPGSFASSSQTSFGPVGHFPLSLRSKGKSDSEPSPQFAALTGPPPHAGEVFGERSGRREEPPLRLHKDGSRSAAAFADAAVRSKKFLPVDRPFLVKAFEAALLADLVGAMSPGWAFAEGGEGEACAALRQMVEERPAHELEDELLDGADRKIAPGDGVSEDRLNELLGKTDLGREVKKARKSKAH